MSTTNHNIEIRAYSVIELANIYKVSRYIFLRWIEPHQSFIGEKQGRYYTTLQVKIIFERLGLPAIVEEE
jgi:hypothetical protein